MKTIFVDTLYWIALINPHDQWRSRAAAVSRTLDAARLVTTDEVLAEVLNFFAEYGNHMRDLAANQVRFIIQNKNVETLFLGRDDFFAGLTLYQERLDKGYSLTDCTSMNIMREHGMTEVLTHDKHFTQEGFTILM